MSDIWLWSYLALWAIVLLQALLLFALMRQMGTIRPVVYRDHFIRRWTFALVLHLLGNVLAAAVVGAMFSLVGGWITSSFGGRWLWIPIVVAPIGLLYSLAEVGFIRLPYP
ncbi:MAG: hypothetical protein ACRDIB_20600, partial [Ardenticatenaceae bacterium]